MYGKIVPTSPAIHLSNFDAGLVRRTSGLDEITPESRATVALSGGDSTLVGKAKASPPPYKQSLRFVLILKEATYHGMPHEERGQLSMLSSGMLNGPLDVKCLIFPAGLPISTSLALMFLVESGFSETALVIRKHGYSTLLKKWVDVLVAADVLAETVHEDKDCFWIISLVRASVNLSRLRAS